MCYRQMSRIMRPGDRISTCGGYSTKTIIFLSIYNAYSKVQGSIEVFLTRTLLALLGLKWWTWVRTRIQQITKG